MAITQDIRTKDYTPDNNKTQTVTIVGRKRAVRLFCTECMGYSWPEVRRCTDRLCPLFHYRMGTPQNEYV